MRNNAIIQTALSLHYSAYLLSRMNKYLHAEIISGTVDINGIFFFQIMSMIKYVYTADIRNVNRFLKNKDEESGG